MSIVERSVIYFLLIAQLIGNSGLVQGQQAFDAQPGSKPQWQPDGYGSPPPQYPPQTGPQPGSQPQWQPGYGSPPPGYQQQGPPNETQSLNNAGPSSMWGSGPGGPQTPAKPNRFATPYPRSGQPFNMSIFVKKGEKLIKKEIDKGTLKKALLIFVGEWCPHCEAFLQSFKESVRILALYGVHIVFVYVPQPPVLQNWRDPTLTEYKSAEEKLAGWGIDVNQPKVSLTMLGSSPDLRRAEVNSLPVAIAVKDGKEVFRGEGSSLVQTLDMRALPTLVDFASILNDDAAQTPDEADKGSESSDEKGSKGKRKKGDKGRRRNDYKKGRASAFGSTSVNREAASHATKLLNEGRSFYTRGTPSESHRSDSQRTGCSCRL